MGTPTYTQVLRDIHTSLAELAKRPAEAGDGLRAALDALARRQDEMLGLLREMNGHVREHSELLARQGQWIEDHTQTHKDLKDQLEYVGKKVNVVAGLNTLMAFIAGALGLTTPRG